MSQTGVISWLITRAAKNVPLQSVALDNLSEVMNVNKIFRRNRLDRFYRARFLMQGGMAFLDRIFFDATYLEMLTSDEVLAVGSHEFTHLNRRHGLKKFLRLILPSIIIGAIIGFLVSFNFALLGFVPLLSIFGKNASILLLGVLSFALVYMACLYVNSKWLCQQETECDLSAVKYVNGEAMVSALIKLNNLRPKRITRLDRFLPKLYPPLEERINAIRTAEREKKS
jgi:Zn-dependent protease with chaperone function